MNLLDELKANPFVVAPMAGITDRAFRSLMRELGGGVVVTELVSATGLRYENKKTRDLMGFDSIQHPIGVQLFGEKNEDMSYAAKAVEDSGADFVDINFGCPVTKVVKKGAGAAALKDPIEFRNTLRAVKSAVSIPVTIKVRTGWDSTSRNSHEIAQIAADEGMTWMAIHGRTRAQGYAGTSDWDYIREVKTTAPLPILGNGDIASAQMANDRLRESGCDGVLIGRGCLKNPWIFREAIGIYQRQNARDDVAESMVVASASKRTDKDFHQLFDRMYFHLVNQTQGETRVTALQIKKLAAWYSTGYPGSANFRKSVFQVQETKTALNMVKDYFSSVTEHIQKDTSHEPFLMGGHG